MTWCLACLSVAFTASTLWADRVPQTPVRIESTASTLLEGMPSFHQRNVEFGRDGRNYCGPTAASNGLMWLANQGYPNLKPTADDDAAAQRVMIKQLASYMGIFREGATASGFKCGVTSYLREAGYAPKSWSVSGGISANGSRTPPDLNLLYTITSRKTLIWLGLGWYRHDPATGKYTRSSGHWVTLAGLDDRAGKDHVARTLIIADPEFPGAHQIITLTAMNVGSLSNGISKADAKGFFLLAKDDTRIENLESRYGVLESIQALTVE